MPKNPRNKPPPDDVAPLGGPYKTPITFRSKALALLIDRLVQEGREAGRFPMNYSRSDWVNDAILGKHKLPADAAAKLPKK